MQMPEIQGISHWFHTKKPLSREELKGRVVLIDFWAYSCVNCLRTIPYLKSWYKKYRLAGLEIIGIHTPEFEFEKDPKNVERAIRQFQIAYPVAMDNEFITWNNFANRYWPAHYFVDKEGVIRATHFGEGDYDRSEKIIQDLLGGPGPGKAPSENSPQASAVELSKIGTPEIYLGYARISHFGSAEDIFPGTPEKYSLPQEVLFNRFYLTGEWTIARESARLESPQGKILLRYRASRANLVMRGPDPGLRAIVRLDGKPVPEKWRGADIKTETGQTFSLIREAKMYNFIDAGSEYGEHLLELELQGSQAEAYAFTFG